jgi:hypothetical protein
MLYVNGTFFVPQMGIASDTSAFQAYIDLGYKAFGVYTKSLADDYDGNIHCVIMNYPVGTFVQSPVNPDPGFHQRDPGAFLRSAI